MILSILTPVRNFYTGEIKSVSLETKDGKLVIQPRYAPFVCSLVDGIATITTASDEKIVASIMSGFAEVINDKVTILTDSAELPDDVDDNRAVLAKERAKQRLLAVKNEEEIDRERALKALTRAEIRIKLKLLNKK
ncbi:MAG: ATP synthase F1 subunit epsilon [Defluviitaleaceae bacterium]|nr:ATP synthase F1 subunit epsilon [Defluviitaleaceae bacterium]